MNVNSSKEIDEIIFETNDKINAIVDEIRLIKFSKLNDEEKQVKYNQLRKEFEEIMLIQEKKITKLMDN